MKKYLSILLCLALCASMAACSSGEPTPEPEEPAVSGEPEDQVKLIAENKDLWLVTDVNEADLYQYAVTDLDENGRLELIATITEGSGQFSTTHFYEVSEDFSKLEPLEYAYGETHSEPDIGWYNALRCYKGEYGNFVIAMDEMRNGYAENYYTQDLIVLKDGVVDAHSISYCMVLAEDSNGDGEPEMHAYYYTSGGDQEEELTSVQFATSVDDFFGYDYDRYVMDVEWQRFSAEERDSEVDIPAALLDSWKAFGFRKDMDEFNGLFVAPSSYYEELYENGEKADITYGMESLADYWQLVEAATELEVRTAEDFGELDCHLIIGQDGMADFYWNDPADARGEISLEGMPISMAEDGMGQAAEEPAEAADPEVTEAPADENAAGWMVVFNTEDGLNRFEATIGPDDGRLYVNWYWWSEEDPGADPQIMKLTFTNGVA